MALCAALFEGVAVWAGLPATLFALMLLLVYRLNTRFTWILLLLGVAGLATEGLSVACTGWSTGTVLLPTLSGLMPITSGLSLRWMHWLNIAWFAGALTLIFTCALAIWRLSRPRQ